MLAGLGAPHIGRMERIGGPPALAANAQGLTAAA
jgi:hypothetical protein